MTNRPDFLKKLFSVSILKGLGMALSFALTVIFAEYFGVESMGRFYKNLSIILGLRLILLMGSNHLVVKFSNEKHYLNSLRYIIGRSLVIYFFLVLLGGILLIFEYGVFGNPPASNFVLVVCSILFAFPLLLSEFLKAAEMPKASVFFEGLGLPVFYLLFSYLFYQFGTKNTDWIIPVSGLIVSFFGLFQLSRSLRRYNYNKDTRVHWKKIEAPAIFLAMMAFSSYLYNGFDIVVISEVLNDEIAGNYVLHKKVAQLIMFLTVVNLSVVAPELVQLISSKGDVFKYVINNILTISIISSLFGIVLYFAGSYYIDYLPVFEINYTALALFFLIQIFNASTSIVGPALIYKGAEKQVSLSFLFTSLISCVLFIVLTKGFGLFGGVIGLLLGIIFQKGILIILLYRNFKKE